MRAKKRKVSKQILKARKIRRAKNELFIQIEKAGYTQQQFARFIGKSRRTVTRWTNNETPIPAYVWHVLNTFLSMERENGNRAGKVRRHL